MGEKPALSSDEKEPLAIQGGHPPGRGGRAPGVPSVGFEHFNSVTEGGRGVRKGLKP